MPQESLIPVLAVHNMGLEVEGRDQETTFLEEEAGAEADLVGMGARRGLEEEDSGGSAILGVVVELGVTERQLQHLPGPLEPMAVPEQLLLCPG